MQPKNYKTYNLCQKQKHNKVKYETIFNINNIIKLLT